MLDKVDSDLLESFEDRSTDKSLVEYIHIARSDIPSLCLFRSLKGVLVLQLCNERLIERQLFLRREVARYGRRQAPLLLLFHAWQIWR